MSNPAEGMPCPVDGTALVMSERSGIEIDYCPTCRGVWLDRGELDKILERNAQQGLPPQVSPSPQAQARSWGGSDWDHGHDSRHYGYKKRKKSFLEELFD